MDYQEILTIYKKNGLVTDRLKKRLDVAKPLKGRPMYRSVELSSINMELGSKILDVVRISERPEKIEEFFKETEEILTEYFEFIVNCIKDCKAWENIKINARDYSKDKFNSLDRTEKFKMIYELNQKYYKFLEFQKLADLRDYFRINKDKELDNDTLKKLSLLKLMFNNIKNEEMKNEVFCLDKEFLIALVNFRKSNCLRIEDYFSTKKKKLQLDYDKYAIFFKVEDFRDIAENIYLCRKATKYSLTKVIEAFYQMSESEAEKKYLKEQLEELKELEQKCKKMKEVKIAQNEERKSQKQVEIKSNVDTAILRKINELEQIKKAKIEQMNREVKKISPDVKVKLQASISDLEDRIDNLKKMPNAKENVIPIIFSWFERDDISLTRKIGIKKINDLLARIKEIETAKGVRASLFFVTNANKEITNKRFQELRRKAKEAGMSKLIEGAFGGYSSFKIDDTGEISDLSIMSDENRQKIKYLLEHTREFPMPREMVDQTAREFLRYKFSNSDDKTITKSYLSVMIGKLLENQNVKKQPLKFYMYMERNNTGIDVLLESQIKGITKLQEYYDTKYHIDNGKMIKLNFDDIDRFIEKNDKSGALK